MPSLRNVGLTPPYFSWGGYANRLQVMKLYNRGLSRRNVSDSPFDRHGTSCTQGDDSGTGPDGDHPWPLTGEFDCNTNVTGVIVPLHLSDCDAAIGTEPRTRCIALGQTTANDELSALVRFMLSLTDYRVQCDQAPFDHPQLIVNDGSFPFDANHDAKADDILSNFPAVGASGYSMKSGYCIPNAGDLFAPGMQARSGGH